MSGNGRCNHCGGTLFDDVEDGLKCIACGRPSRQAPGALQIVIEDSEMLGKACIDRAREFLSQANEHQSEISRLKRNAVRFVQIAQMCEVPVSPDLLEFAGLSGGKQRLRGPRTTTTVEVRCDQCGRPFRGNHALSVHKARTHGPGWDTTKNLKGEDAA